MSDATLPPSQETRPRTKFDFFVDEDDDDLTISLSLPVQTSVVITPGAGSLEIRANHPQTKLKPLWMPGWSRHVRGEVRIAKRPRLWWSWIARMLMSPAGYRSYCAPHIADMHAEYFQCLKDEDEWGARRAVIRANLYAVPSWFWGLAAAFMVRVIAWFRA